MVRFPRLSDYGRISWTASSLVALLKAVLVSGIVLIALLYDRPAQGLAIPSAYQPNIYTVVDSWRSPSTQRTLLASSLSLETKVKADSDDETTSTLRTI
jgi:hypothetical protein